MRVISIDKNLNATVGEFINALKLLGYKDTTPNKNSRSYQYSNKEFDSIVNVPALPLEEKILKATIGAYSALLYEQGVIEDIQDISKMILQARLEATQKAEA
jgi:hypothetical protein